MKKSKLFIANIVLGSVFGAFLCISIIVMIFFHIGFEEVERSYEAYGKDYYQDILDNAYDWNYDYWDYDNDDDWDYDYTWDYASVYYTIPSITGASAELIGPVYQEQEATEGYQYYKVTMQVQNAGTDYIIVDYMDLSVSGEEYEDVYYYYEPYTDEVDDFEYSNLELIPSCQTATVSFVVEVKDTVDDVIIEISGDNYTEENASYALNLK